MPNPVPTKVRFTTRRPADYKALACSGATVAANGDGMVCADFFVDRVQPDEVTEVQLDAIASQIVAYNSMDGSTVLVSRELQCAIVATPQTARLIAELLLQKAGEAESAVAAAKAVTKVGHGNRQ